MSDVGAASAPTTNSDGPRTLWMGDLAFWVDEGFLMSVFAPTGEVVSTKVIRNKFTGYSEGYGFVEFATSAAAMAVLQTYNGTPIPGTDLFFKLNWASHSSPGGASSSAAQRGGSEDGAAPEHSVFVGDLSPEVTDYALQEYFRQFYQTVKSARVVTDPVTGRPKGYGFVRFLSEGDRDKAIVEMNGQVVGSRAIRVCLATPKRTGSGGGLVQGLYHLAGLRGAPPGGFPAGMRGGGAGAGTLYIGGVAAGTTEDDVRAVFAPFGSIVYVKIAHAKACAFVQFRQREAAARALQATNGQVINGSPVRVSWGRHSEHHIAASAQMMRQHASAGLYGYYNHFYGFADPSPYYTASYTVPPPQVMSDPGAGAAAAAAAAASAAAAAAAASISGQGPAKGPPGLADRDANAPATVEEMGSKTFVSGS